MKSLAVELFGSYAFVVIFLHVLSAIVWIGGMIAMRISVYPLLEHIDDPKKRLARRLEIGRSFFVLVMPFVAILLLTGLVMSLALGASGTSHGLLMHAKEGIWTVMALNYAFAARRRSLAQRRFLSGDIVGAQKIVDQIANAMLPLNVLLGIVALALGITLRGF